MSEAGLFVSALGPTIARYLALKEALGRRFGAERRILTHLDTFLHATESDFTAESLAHWGGTLQHLSSGVRRTWLRIARNLCLYRRRTEPTCFVPDSSQFPPSHQPVQPHIFTDAEVVRLLGAAQMLEPANCSPLRRENFRLALVPCTPRDCVVVSCSG